MLTLLLGTDWTVNRDKVLSMIAQNVSNQMAGQILMVPELISHDTERRLCSYAGDTASRFAEVLTFTRLAKRVSDAAGYGAPECLDAGGRLVAMASACRQLHSKLKAYAAVEAKPEFLMGMIEAVDEFKRCCISPADLTAASQKTEGSFAQKLEELALILEAYDSVCARGKRDPRDLMNWILEELEVSTFAQDHSFFIDGFPDFTRQHTAVLSHLIIHSTSVVVSLTCDGLHTSEPAFEKASATAVELLRLAKQAGVEVKVVSVDSGSRPVCTLLSKLFQGRIDSTCDILKTYRTESVYQECHHAAEQITQLVLAGERYRDISVVCADMALYDNMLQMVFSRYGIPLYLSGTEDILDKTVITTVLSAIDAAVGGFEQSDVLRYLRSALSPLSLTECDRLENYAILWNITGNRWDKTWENHPDGLGANWTDKNRAYLAELNQCRAHALTPLFHLGKSLNNAKCLGEIIDSLYAFLDEIRLADQLESFALQMEASGDLRTAQILSQLWEILLGALDQLRDTLGDTAWDPQTFTKLLKLLLSQYDVGSIPAVLDTVMAGPVSAMRCQQPKHLLILGAVEGSFPAYSGTTGIFTDQERLALRQMGVPLTGGAMEGLQAEFAEIYGVFCGAEKSVCVSYPDGQPSFLYRRLCDMTDSEITAEPLCFALTDADEASAYLLRHNGDALASELNIRDQYQQLCSLKNHTFGAVDPKTVETLYGSQLKLSASQVDKLADCRLAYFLKYGMKLKERKTATVDPAEFGTYVHAVLEETGRKVMQSGGFHKVSLEDTLQIANEFSQAYITERFSQIDSQRIQYLFRRNAQELMMVVTELWEELQASNFEPVDFELSFGMQDGLDAIAVTGKTMTAMLRGLVDRVDAWNENGQVYYRVVDYKTGKKDFDYCDIYNGLGLQMLLYLFALEDHGGELLGSHPVGAGVQYFPARAPLVTLDGKPDETEAQKAREAQWKRKGLLLNDEAVLQAMEPAEKPKRLAYSRKKDGTISGDLADRRQLQLLKGYVFALLGKMVDEISSGCVDPNPYTRGSRHNACAFCPYTAVCRERAEDGRRNYAAINAQKFWEEIEKEVNRRG